MRTKDRTTRRNAARAMIMAGISTAVIYPQALYATGDEPIRMRDAVIGTAPNGTSFSAGLLERLAFYHLENLDLVNDNEFRAVTVADLTQGDSRFALRSITDLSFQFAKGPVSLLSVLEVEAVVDELVADVNHVNLEQIVGTYAIPDNWGSLSFGWGVHVMDPEGTLVYGDEAPGLWWQGARNQYSWNVGYVKRIDGNRGTLLSRSGNTFPGDRSFTAPTIDREDVDSDVMWARGGYNFGSTTLSPFVLINVRNTPQSATSVFPCPLAAPGSVVAGDCQQGANGNPTVTDNSSSGTFWFPGLVMTSEMGPTNITAEVAGRFGSIDDLPTNTYAISADNPNGISSFDVNAFSVFAEIALKEGMLPHRLLRRLVPYTSVQVNSGDSDPYDDNMGGYVALSDLNTILRKDSFNLRSISSYGAMTLGGACEGTFGFNTSGRGTGPTMGTSNEDASLASPVFFNNRCGKGDNPGMVRWNIGYVGGIGDKWVSKFVVSPMWFYDTESIKAEAAGSRLGRGIDPLGVAGTANAVRATASTLDIDSFMGTEINMNLGYNVTENFAVRAFGSVFVPGAGAEDINRLFLDNSDAETAWLSGVELIANF